MSRKPKIIVFDLDYTLWPFWVDTHFTPPFKKKGSVIVDAHGKIIHCYKEVPAVLKRLSDEGYELGVASRTSEIQGANQLLNLFNWEQYFKYKEIYPGNKLTHFSKIQKASGNDYKDMIFFDDEHRNIVDVNKLGVTCIFVRDGVSHTVVENALKDF
ncbi:PREDICTED: magnesium-dependent phosphatase 1-like [Dufourea novaeangliae]|uniref:Magnesium-dependent phosphatase 1 n=1 Tax=Dufourea novaeangliae TaxID=178035 RepID=A0A154PFI9_DUFNO|nr:PREDICTED: magnesium-dependent phosphatase 1-like [Dufourea novaeangliae]KZC10646.1 Magnesium-dependent phosphatase 1 [Dufourea novaeangliae]